MFGLRRKMADLERRVRALELSAVLDAEDTETRHTVIWEALARAGRLIHANAVAVLQVATNHAKLSSIVAGEEPEAPTPANDQPKPWVH